MKEMSESKEVVGGELTGPLKRQVKLKILFYTQSDICVSYICNHQKEVLCLTL